jgi:long-subunit acyl-CoA synthetase (AMP-forming)
VHSLLAVTTPFALFSTYATPREMTHTLTKSKSTHIFVHASLLANLLPVAREHGFPEDHIYILEGQPSTGPNLPSFGQLIQNVRYNKIPREPVRQAGKDTLAYLVFSSGTSGLPKGNPVQVV